MSAIGIGKATFLSSWAFKRAYINPSILRKTTQQNKNNEIAWVKWWLYAKKRKKTRFIVNIVEPS